MPNRLEERIRPERGKRDGVFYSKQNRESEQRPNEASSDDTPSPHTCVTDTRNNAHSDWRIGKAIPYLAVAPKAMLPLRDPKRASF